MSAECFRFIIISLNAVQVISLQKRDYIKKKTNIHDEPRFAPGLTKSKERELNQLSHRQSNRQI